MNQIIRYVKSQYRPLAVIVYGSFADGTSNEHSDFDALVISRDHPAHHDVSFVAGVQLDVFVYPASHFDGEYDPDEFVQAADGRILMDTDGVARALVSRVREYLDALPAKTYEDIRSEIEWCRKMLLRTARADSEGLYRWHWLLTESLEIFSDSTKQHYRGPKKTLLRMKTEHPESFALYERALSSMDAAALKAWIDHLSSLI